MKIEQLLTHNCKRVRKIARVLIPFQYELVFNNTRTIIAKASYTTLVFRHAQTLIRITIFSREDHPMSLEIILADRKYQHYCYPGTFIQKIQNPKRKIKRNYLDIEMYQKYILSDNI